MEEKKGILINLTIPTGWETLTYQEFMDVCKILCLDYDRDTTLILCLFKLAKLKWPGKTYDPEAIAGLLPAIKDGKELFLNAATIKLACEKLSFIFDSVGLPPCPFPKMNRRLYGMPFGKYYEADSYIRRYYAQHENAFLNHAASVLTDGRVRKLTPWQRKGLIIWWNGLTDYLMERFPDVLVSGGSISNLNQVELLEELLLAINEGKPQDNEKILSCDTYSVLLTLQNKYHNAKQRSSV